MPADIVGDRLLPAKGQELITIMDDYGTAFQLYVMVTDSANRQTNITNALTQQSGNQAALESYATTHGIDLTAEKAAGIGTKLATLASNGLTLATTCTLTASSTEAAHGTAITLTATLASANVNIVPTGAVTFLDGTTVLGTATPVNGVATLTTSALAVGAHSITASEAAIAGLSASTSAPVAITIN
jgi:Bacterial Ig-like domain (group 3)